MPRGGAGGQRVELARTLRRTRDQLISADGMPPRIELELLRQHVPQFSAGLPILAIIVGAAGALFALADLPVMIAWVCLNLLTALPLLVMLRAFEKTAPSMVAAFSWRRRFQACHVVLGVPWAILMLWPTCKACGFEALDAVRLAVAVAAIATLALIGASLKGVVLWSFGPLALAAAYLTSTTDDPSRMALHGVLLAAVPFFAVVSSRLRASKVDRIRHRTERDQFTFEIEAARIASDQARQRAEEANLAKSQFLATMSHELRTPLNAILGFSEVISEEILGPVGNDTYRDYARDIHNSGQHLLDLINEILDLSRVEAGRYTLNEEAVSLVAIAKAAIGFVQMKADTKRIEIRAEFEPDLPQLWGDPRSLRQVILNLLSNAVKFTPPKGHILVRVGWTAGGGQYVSVRDNGPGIPKEEMPLVLSSFGQGTNAIKSAEQGTGLGLPIVQALVSLHNGSFELSSAPGQGTEALATFPHARVLEVMPALSDLS
ncbi:sensor histidine kinase [Aureimonas phyllosphaerae]|uniref:histidine kinase n=1 Tax=Aureimonas phyllosphaerae TaxID=1166078 RepID=A0A7W6FUY5_9HYPH|nr:HAMP domain-containing sensor histidine kinase [Aureimonas phyllosphaerae]MBB3935492.1 two-component system cell cycle sensor histidine kinase PleC [Aureimonas phyllosphaerae]MBB3959500.1 two-component system cell cycle sensor histidine kinase PleC [Aureimonas phyllosphaerae]SFF11318.1 two-component system, cell cycle sensor histidine kinase PleC [Aureimonas phyllosphaerae]